MELYLHSRSTYSWYGAYEAMDGSSCRDAQLNTGHVFMVWDVIKHSDNFTFTLL
jgi:hypothetical protein